MVKHPELDEILKWSNIAYDLASALVGEMMDGSDGPPKPPCRLYACDCKTHKALEAWGDAQEDLLNEIEPEWYKRVYGENSTYPMRRQSD